MVSTHPPIGSFHEHLITCEGVAESREWDREGHTEGTKIEGSGRGGYPTMEGLRMARGTVPRCFTSSSSASAFVNVYVLG